MYRSKYNFRLSKSHRAWTVLRNGQDVRDERKGGTGETDQMRWEPYLAASRLSSLSRAVTLWELAGTTLSEMGMLIEPA